MDVNITIQNLSGSNSIPSNRQLKQWAALPLASLNKMTELTIRIVDEDEGQQLNAAWRDKDYATNVLSFPIGETNEHAPAMLGDIVICAPVVEKEAEQQGKKLESHWAHLVIHGILHLQGYDHEHHEDASKMEKLEITLLEKIG